ncbi:MAG: cyclic nucleotide-binding domain-containing protein [Candidatus Eremiobacteraeota bacterium]|nr:cyclic nucleotide-binding domain-containing protein [Candidatus Eremiobacteraeota bacterium]
MDPQEKAAIFDNLAKIDFLTGVAREKLDELSEKLVRISFDAGDHILKEGRAGGAFFILVSGTISIWAEGNEGSSMKLSELTPYSYFGEIALLTNTRRTATVKAESDVVVYMLGKEAFNSILISDASIRQRLEKVAGERKHETDKVLCVDPEASPAFFSNPIGK